MIGTARPMRVAFPTARAAERASFSVAPDESWLVYSQEDYSSRDIMLLRAFPDFRVSPSNASEDFRKLQPKTLFVRRPASVSPY